MVGEDAVDDIGTLVVLAGQFAAKGDVRAFRFVVNRLADVVQQTCALGKLNIRASSAAIRPADG